jgi:hypothetical protein
MEVTMTVNVDNINLMIEAISKQAEPIQMADWVVRNEPCGTTACLAGWANILANHAQGKLNAHTGYIGKDKDNWIDLSNTTKAAEWMGLVDEDGRPRTDLFYRGAVDRLSPADRKTAALALLDKLRDDGNADWYDIVEADYDDNGYPITTLKA